MHKITDIPHVRSYNCGLAIFICSIIFSGWSIIVAAIIDNCKGWQIFVGIVQIITTPLIIGWVWAIIWGFKIWDKNRAS